MTTLVNWLLEALYPRKCVGCGKGGSYVCKECEVGMWEEEQICPICCRNSRYGLRHKYCKGDLEGLTCYWAYEGMAKKFISRAKYNGQFDVLETLISKFEFLNKFQFFNFQKFLEISPVVVPVPLHPRRLRERGFNQADIIAEAFASRHSLACNSHLLLRVKETSPQVGKTREERMRSMAGAFEIKHDSSFMIPDSVLLVDDVWTTGATMRECSRVLKKAGVGQIWGFVLAR